MALTSVVKAQQGIHYVIYVTVYCWVVGKKEDTHICDNLVGGKKEDTYICDNLVGGKKEDTYICDSLVGGKKEDIYIYIYM